MRNIKRVLSLALASVMLLGMMVVGSSAAFNDADKIVNTKAATVTAGLGLFAGTTDGNFDPTGTVTRAQMAAVISKMIYGSDVNADSFKGAGKFSDTASFEGGWAEGYINLCVNLGVVSGYGDGTFRPGNAVTTAEAVTMLINALKVDAGEGQWPMTVMAAAETIKLFSLEEELSPKPATNAALTRDELSVMTLNALYYSPEGGNVYVVNGQEFDNVTDAWMFNGMSSVGISIMPAQDTLASETFEMLSETGYVTANQATGEDFTVVAGKSVALETGLDMIGHYVTVYYAEEYESEDEPGVAYCIVDEAKYVTVDANSVDTKKEFNKYFNKAYDLAEDGVIITDGEYFVATSKVDEIDGYDADNYEAGKGTYAIFEGEIIAFIADPTPMVSKINKVNTTSGKESITVNGIGLLNNNEDEDEVVEYEGVAKDDIVLVYSAQGTVYTLVKAESVEGKITRTSTTKDGDVIVNTITVDGKVYPAFGADEFSADSVTGRSGLSNDLDVNFDKTYEIYTVNGKYIGWQAVASEAELGDVVYVLGSYPIATTDAYGNDVTTHYAQAVDMEGKEISVLIGIDYAANDAVDYDGEIEDLGDINGLAAGYYTFELSDDKDEKKANIMVGELLDTVYDEDENNIYTGEITKELSSSTTSAKTAADEVAFLADTTKFIVVEGSIGETLEIAVKTGTIKKDVTEVPVILSQDEAGNVTLEVMVIFDEVSIVSEDLIFVSLAQLEGVSQTADGYTYEVYFTETAEIKTITVDAKLDEDGVGFYEYSFDATENVYELDFEGAISFDMFVSLYKGTTLVSAVLEEGVNAAEAKIIDLRSEEELEESQVAEITELADLADAASADHHVFFYLLLDEDGENVEHIIVVSVIAEEDLAVAVDNEDGTHDLVCIFCDDVVEEAVECKYDEDTHECVCGAVDPDSL